MTSPTTPDPKKEAIARAAVKVLQAPPPDTVATEKDEDPAPVTRRSTVGAVVFGYLAAAVFTYLLLVAIRPQWISMDPRELMVWAVFLPWLILPAYLALRLMHRFGLWQIVLANSALSVIDGLMFASRPSNGLGTYDIRHWSIGANLLYGAAVGATFWAVFRWSEHESRASAELRPPSLARLIAAFLLAPLPVGIFIAVVLGYTGAGSLRDIFAISVIAQGVASVSAVVLGLPAYLLFRWMGWLGPLQTVFAGAILGFIWGMVQIPAGYPQSNHIAPVAYGAVVAALFWVIALRRRPE